METVCLLLQSDPSEFSKTLLTVVDWYYKTTHNEKHKHLKLVVTYCLIRTDQHLAKLAF